MPLARTEAGTSNPLLQSHSGLVSLAGSLRPRTIVASLLRRLPAAAGKHDAQTPVNSAPAQAGLLPTAQVSPLGLGSARRDHPDRRTAALARPIARLATADGERREHGSGQNRSRAAPAPRLHLRAPVRPDAGPTQPRIDAPPSTSTTIRARTSTRARPALALSRCTRWGSACSKSSCR